MTHSLTMLHTPKKVCGINHGISQKVHPCLLSFLSVELFVFERMQEEWLKSKVIFVCLIPDVFGVNVSCISSRGKRSVTSANRNESNLDLIWTCISAPWTVFQKDSGRCCYTKMGQISSLPVETIAEGVTYGIGHVTALWRAKTRHKVLTKRTKKHTTRVIFSLSQEIWTMC